MNWILANKEWIFSGIGISAALLIIWSLKILFKRISKKFCWVPATPFKNSNLIKNISEYPSDYEIDFQGKRILNNLIGGEKAFCQRIIMLIHTECGKYKIYNDSYGIEQAETIFAEKSPEEFSRQSNSIALQLMQSETEWIEEIFRISRNKEGLTIELKVKGKPDTLKCVVPNIHKEKRCRK